MGNKDCERSNKGEQEREGVRGGTAEKSKIIGAVDDEIEMGLSSLCDSRPEFYTKEYNIFFPFLECKMNSSAQCT
jgi:hypothetical protein